MTAFRILLGTVLGITAAGLTCLALRGTQGHLKEMIAFIVLAGSPGAFVAACLLAAHARRLERERRSVVETVVSLLVCGPATGLFVLVGSSLLAIPWAGGVTIYYAALMCFLPALALGLGAGLGCCIGFGGRR